MKCQGVASYQYELNSMVVEQLEQISEVWLNFHDIAFSDSLLLPLSLLESCSTSKPGLSLQKSDPLNSSFSQSFRSSSFSYGAEDHDCGTSIQAAGPKRHGAARQREIC